MPSIVQSINEFKFSPTKEEILSFLLKRQSLKEGEEVDDYILNNSKFLNVFREDDAVSQVINRHLDRFDNVDNPTFAKHCILMRLINHRDLIPIFYENLDLNNLKSHMEWFTSRDSTVCNPGAYQINPRIGFDMGYRNIRDAMVYKIPKVLDDVASALVSTNQIDEATDAANQAFGGFSNFWMFQAAIDISWHRPNIMDHHSHPYMGSGSKQAVIDMDMLRNYLNETKPASWRLFFPYDVENALCEYRKYCMRTEKGIPNNRKYVRKLI